MPRKNGAKPKSTLAQAVKHKLDAMARRHRMKIGGPIPPDDVILNVVRVGVSREIHKTALEQSILGVENCLQGEAQKVVLEFKSFLAGEQVEAPVVGAYTVTANFAETVRDYFRRRWPWLQRFIREPKTVDIKVAGKATFDVVYPHLQLPKILPEVKGVLVRVRGVEPNKEVMTAGVE